MKRAVPQPSSSTQVHRRGDLRVTIGPPRVVMRGTMFPLPLVRFGDGGMTLSAVVVEGKGPVHSIRSDDSGRSWRPSLEPFCGGTTRPGEVYTNPSTLELRSGKSISLGLYNYPIAGKPGWYHTRRWESFDHVAHWVGVVDVRCGGWNDR
jgi:hypothetical protein